MEKPCFYEIRIKGRLSDRWSAWFEGMIIHNDRDDETILSGAFVDQAALLGVLRIED